MNARWLHDLVRSQLGEAPLTNEELREVNSFLQALAVVPQAQLTDITRAIRTYVPKGGRTRPLREKGRRRLSKSISEITQLLRESYGDDRAFETAVEVAADSSLTKADLTNVYCGLFETKKEFPKSKTRPDILDAIRHERFARVRFK